MNQEEQQKKSCRKDFKQCERGKGKRQKQKEFRRVSPSNDSEEKDEMELCCNTGQEKERSKTSRETEKKAIRKTHLREKRNNQME